MKDKRNFVRIKVDVPALLYENRGNRELSCRVSNVSEQGICFEVPRNEKGAAELSIGESVLFQFIDTLLPGKDKDMCVLCNSSQIRHIDVNDKHYVVGCYIHDGRFGEYARMKQISTMYPEMVGA